MLAVMYDNLNREPKSIETKCNVMFVPFGFWKVHFAATMGFCYLEVILVVGFSASFLSGFLQPNARRWMLVWRMLWHTAHKCTYCSMHSSYFTTHNVFNASAAILRSLAGSNVEVFIRNNSIVCTIKNQIHFGCHLKSICTRTRTLTRCTAKSEIPTDVESRG